MKFVITICFIFLSITFIKAQNVYQDYLDNYHLLEPVGFNPSVKYLAYSVIRNTTNKNFDNPPSVKQIGGYGKITARDYLGLKVKLYSHGSTDETQISLGYNFRAKLTSTSIFSVGLWAGWTSMRTNIVDVYVLQENDPTINNDYLKESYFTCGLGFHYLSHGYSVDVTIPEVIMEQAEINPEVLIMLGANYGANSNNIRLRPHLMYYYNKGLRNLADLGFKVTFQEKFSIDFGGQTTQCGYMGLGYVIADQFDINMAYTVGFSKVQNVNQGMVQLSLTYRISENRSYMYDNFYN